MKSDRNTAKRTQNRISDHKNKVLLVRTGKALTFAVPMMIYALYELTAAYASDTIIHTAARSTFGTIYGAVKAVAIAVAVIALVISAYQIIINGERGMEKARKTMLMVLVGLIIIFIAPLIVQTIRQWRFGRNNPFQHEFNLFQ